MSYFNLISILETEDCIADIIGALRALESHKDHARLPHDLIFFGIRLCQPEFQDHPNLLDAAYRLVDKLPEKARPAIRRIFPTQTLWNLKDSFPNDGFDQYGRTLKPHEEDPPFEEEAVLGEVEESIRWTDSVLQTFIEDLESVLVPQHGGRFQQTEFYDGFKGLSGRNVEDSGRRYFIDSDRKAGSMVGLQELVSSRRRLNLRLFQIPLWGYQEEIPVVTLQAPPNEYFARVNVFVLDPQQEDPVRERTEVYNQMKMPLTFVPCRVKEE